MAGNQEGGRKSAKSNKERYGEDVYEKRGRAGGKKSKGGGFTNNPHLASEAGKIGGKISKRPKKAAPTISNLVYYEVFDDIDDLEIEDRLIQAINQGA